MDEAQGAGQPGEPPAKVVEDLCDRFGFEAEEAAAYWHLQHAQRIMAGIKDADVAEEEIRGREGSGEENDLRAASAGLVGAMDDRMQYEARVRQHFSAIRRALMVRV